jgi:hypothetical protein
MSGNQTLKTAKIQKTSKLSCNSSKVWKSNSKRMTNKLGFTLTLTKKKYAKKKGREAPFYLIDYQQS